MRKRIAFAAALALAPAAASAETWMVVEGADGRTKGAWSVVLAGSAINGAATMKTGRGATVTYQIAGNVQGGNYVIQRVSPSDGVACAYVGKAAGPKAINGSAKCGTKSAPWKAVRAN
ncbi:MAG TPA: hypothetical protein PKA55_10355 [Rhodoblastus sp.]|nr:hypothetical protein [Rhodoblastus sp.]